MDGDGAPWQNYAACASVDPELFFPKHGDTFPAKRICAGCPVLLDCLEYATVHNEPSGIWGGLTPEERAVRARRNAVWKLITR